MTAACSLSNEKLVGLEEGLYRLPVEISVKKKKKSICKKLLQYGSILLCIELIVLGHWALYNIWQNYDSTVMMKDPPVFPTDSLDEYDELQREEPNLRSLETSLHNFNEPIKSESDYGKNEAYLRGDLELFPAPIPKEIPRVIEHELRDSGENIEDFDPECLVNIVSLSSDEEKIDEVRKKYELSMEEKKPWRMRHYLKCVKRNTVLRDKTILIEEKFGISHLCVFKEVSSVAVLECVKTVKTGGLTDSKDKMIRNGEMEDRSSNSKSFENFSNSGESEMSAEPFARTVPGKSVESTVDFVYPKEEMSSEQAEKSVFDSLSNSHSSEADGSRSVDSLENSDHMMLENLIHELFKQQIGDWTDEPKEEQSLDSPVIIAPFEIAERFIRSAERDDSVDDSSNKS